MCILTSSVFEGPGAPTHREGLQKTNGSVSRNSASLRGSQKNTKKQSFTLFRKPDLPKIGFFETLSVLESPEAPKSREGLKKTNVSDTGTPEDLPRLVLGFFETLSRFRCFSIPNHWFF